jgi:hypothetical protein
MLKPPFQKIENRYLITRPGPTDRIFAGNANIPRVTTIMVSVKDAFPELYPQNSHLDPDSNSQTVKHSRRFQQDPRSRNSLLIIV